MKGVGYYRPRSLEEAWDLQEKIPGARFIAGGTDVMVQLRNQKLPPPALISLRSIPELTGVDLGEDGRVTRIGALSTMHDLIGHPGLAENYPVLLAAARRVGSPQIRHVATIGGNLCNASPCADTAPSLLVLEARVRLQSARGSRELRLEDYFVGPGQSRLAPDEIFIAVLLDPPARKARATFLKKGRVTMDLAIASVALRLEMEGSVCRRARVAAGSVAPTPLRLTRVEALLEEGPIDQEVLARAQALAHDSVSPITDIRSTAEYRRQITGVFVRRAAERLLFHPSGSE